MAYCYRRYPVSQNEYTQKTGRLLAHRLWQQFTEQGHNTWICKGQNKGVDLKVLDCFGKEVIVAEVLNWSPKTNLSEKRKGNIIRNLLNYDCNKVLIYTAMGNEKNLAELRLLGISTLKIGYQILPKQFYWHFEAKNQVEGRKIDSRETTAHIKARVLEYLQLLRLKP